MFDKMMFGNNEFALLIIISLFHLQFADNIGEKNISSKAAKWKSNGQMNEQKISKIKDIDEYNYRGAQLFENRLIGEKMYKSDQLKVTDNRPLLCLPSYMSYFTRSSIDRSKTKLTLHILSGSFKLQVYLHLYDTALLFYGPDGFGRDVSSDQLNIYPIWYSVYPIWNTITVEAIDYLGYWRLQVSSTQTVVVADSWERVRRNKFQSITVQMLDEIVWYEGTAQHNCEMFYPKPTTPSTTSITQTQTIELMTLMISTNFKQPTKEVMTTPVNFLNTSNMYSNTTTYKHVQTVELTTAETKHMSHTLYEQTLPPSTNIMEVTPNNSSATVSPYRLTEYKTDSSAVDRETSSTNNLTDSYLVNFDISKLFPAKNSSEYEGLPSTSPEITQTPSSSASFLHSFENTYSGPTISSHTNTYLYWSAIDSRQNVTFMSDTETSNTVASGNTEMETVNDNDVVPTSTEIFPDSVISGNFSSSRNYSSGTNSTSDAVGAKSTYGNVGAIWFLLLLPVGIALTALLYLARRRRRRRTQDIRSAADFESSLLSTHSLQHDSITPRCSKAKIGAAEDKSISAPRNAGGSAINTRAAVTTIPPTSVTSFGDNF